MAKFPVAIFSVLLHLLFLSSTFAQDIEDLKTGVVKITAEVEGRQKIGTGFVIHLEEGAVYVLTASHVVEGAREIEMEFFPRRYREIPAEVIQIESGDPRGLALLLAEDDIPSDLTVLALGTADDLSGGDPVITIGFPRISGVPWAVITGNIIGKVGKGISFSGPVEKGNSGGPLIAKGQVIGIVTEVIEPYAYAVSATIARYLLEEAWGIRLKPEGTDLSILSADSWEFEGDGRFLVLHVEVTNQGTDHADETQVSVRDVGNGMGSSRGNVPGLDPGEITVVDIRLKVPDEQRGTTHWFVARVDPDGQIGELDEQNNVQETPGIAIPSRPSRPTGNQVVATISVGRRPLDLAISRDGTRVYVTHLDSNDVTVFDTIQNEVIKSIRVDKKGDAYLAITPDGTKAFVTSGKRANNVSVIDTASNTVVAEIPVGQNPLGVAITPDGTEAYVANHASNNVSVIDTDTHAAWECIEIEKPFDVAMSPDGRQYYVAHGHDKLSIVSIAPSLPGLRDHHRVETTILVGITPFAVAVSPDGTRVYVANSNSNHVSVVETGNNKVIATIPVGKYPRDVAVTPDGRRVYVSNRDDNTVSVIDASSNTLIATISVGVAPEGLAIAPDGAQVYVANLRSDSLSVIE